VITHEEVIGNGGEVKLDDARKERQSFVFSSHAISITIRKATVKPHAVNLSLLELENPWKPNI
jgi:hypothetical protein